MTLVDSSAWIEYFRPQGRSDMKDAISRLLIQDQAAVNGIIRVELLAFARTPEEYAALEDDLLGCHQLSVDEEIFERASRWGFGFRKKGLTVPLTDLLIFTCAQFHGAVILHADQHFEQMRALL